MTLMMLMIQRGRVKQLTVNTTPLVQSKREALILCVDLANVLHPLNVCMAGGSEAVVCVGITKAKSVFP